MNLRRHLRLTGLILALGVASQASGQGGAGTDSSSATVGFVTAVPAGHLLVVALSGGATTVRLLGADAPVLGKNPGGREFFAENSRDFARRLALRRRVSLVKDESGPDRDGEGHLLRHVRLPGNRLLDRELIRSGHGFAARDRDFVLQAEFIAIEATARKAGGGLWAGQGIVEAEWFMREGRAVFKVHRMTDASWGIQLGPYLRSHVAGEDLDPMLARCRRWTETLTKDVLQERLLEDGFVKVDPGKDGWRGSLRDEG